MEPELAKKPEIKQSLGKEVLDDLKNNPVVVFFDKFFDKTNHELIIPAAAFFDALLVILPLEIMSVGYVLKHKATNILKLAFQSGLTSTLGAIIVYYLGSLFFPFFDQIFNLSESASYVSFRDIFIDHKILLVLSAAFFSTIPFTPLCLLSGFFRIDMLVFVTATFVARTFRLYLVMFFTKKWGAEIIEKFFTKFIFASLVITAGIIYFVFFR